LTQGFVSKKLPGVFKAAMSFKASLGVVVASNVIDSESKAYAEGAGVTLTAKSGGVRVDSEDRASIDAEASLAPSSAASLGSSVVGAATSFLPGFEVNFTDRSGLQRVRPGNVVQIDPADFTTGDFGVDVAKGDRVLLDSSVGGGALGDVYDYIGEAPLSDVDFSVQDFKDTTKWKRIDATPGKKYIYVTSDIFSSTALDLGEQSYINSASWSAWDTEGLVKLGAEIAGELIDVGLGKLTEKLGGGQSTPVGFGGLFVRNELTSNVDAHLDAVQLTAAGDVYVRALDSTRISAEDESEVSAGDFGLNVVVATNTLVGAARAWVKGGSLTTTVPGADVQVRSVNRAVIDATVNSKVSATTSVGVTLALNTIGWRPNNIAQLSKDATIEKEFATRSTFRTEASIDGTTIDVKGNLDARAESIGTVLATIEGSALALNAEFGAETDPSGKVTGENAISISAAPVIALNRVAAETKAYITNSPSVRTGGDLSVVADGRTSIGSTVKSSSTSISFSGKGNAVGVSIGFSMARNDNDNDVIAFLSGLANGSSTVMVGGNVRVSTDRSAAIDSKASATSVSVALSPKGNGVSVGG
jgi:hypothetical protein